MVKEQDDRASIGSGNIDITLGDEELTLRPSFRAAKTISTKYGGFTSAIERIMRLEIDVIADVISSGLGYTSTKRPPQDMAEKVYNEGLTDDSGRLAERCVLFVRVLASGGRMPGESDEALDDVDPQTS